MVRPWWQSTKVETGHQHRWNAEVRARSWQRNERRTRAERRAVSSTVAAKGGCYRADGVPFDAVMVELSCCPPATLVGGMAGSGRTHGEISARLIAHHSATLSGLGVAEAVTVLGEISARSTVCQLL